MDNWDDADVQFNISLGNYDMMDKYVDEKMGIQSTPIQEAKPLVST